MEKALVAISLFVCVTYAFQTLVSARLRVLLLRASPSESLLRALMEEEAHARRQGALRWGLVLTLVAAAFALLEVLRWTQVTPGSVAVVLFAAGVAHLGYYALDRRLGTP